ESLVPVGGTAEEEAQTLRWAARKLLILGELLIEFRLELWIFLQHLARHLFRDEAVHRLLLLENAVEEAPGEKGVRSGRLEKVGEEKTPRLRGRNEERAGGHVAPLRFPGGLDLRQHPSFIALRLELHLGGSERFYFHPGMRRSEHPEREPV